VSVVEDRDSVRTCVVSASGALGILGDHGTRLLAGPPASAGVERRSAHLARLGGLDLVDMEPEALRATVRHSGLEGRGGGQFPTAAKLELAATSPGSSLVVVNASEGEPSSRKDRTLLGYRPHLVLDGAMAAARACGAPHVVVYLHRARRVSTSAMLEAIEERRGDVAEVTVVDAPPRYVAGESSALVGYLDGEGAFPRRRRLPVAAAGVGGRPTVVLNAETSAHLGLIARNGAEWFRDAGDAGSPGSSLVTLAGSVAVPGLVVEVLAATTVGEALSRFGGVDEPPAAVLIGGYEGTWVDGSGAVAAPLGRGALAACGTPLGCGLLCVLDGGHCGLRTTARLVEWLAGESAGQCGPCVFGLPEVAATLSRLAGAGGARRDVRRLRQLTASIVGRGDCGHPTGVVGLVDSALDTFASDLDRHARGRPCTAPAAPLELAASIEAPR